MLINKSYVAAGTPTTPHEISCGRVEPQACHEQKFTSPVDAHLSKRGRIGGLAAA
jgi:hypothetical protein